MQDEILFTIKNTTGVVTLNRPSALNALNADMLTALHTQLLQWEKNEAILSVLIQSSSPRVFCAGGDIKAVYANYKNNKNIIKDYFKREYELNLYIHQYPKLFMALLDGLTMGGGAGVSLHAKYRIATEHFSFAMPETGIGFFPDVGISYLLARLPNHIGIYLGLTGTRINATEAGYLKLIDLDGTNHSQENLIKKHELLISQHFKFNSVEEIIESLLNNPTPWTDKTLKILRQKSPTSLKLSLKQLQNAQNMSIEQCIAQDYKLACYFVENHDFYEGIRAAVIDKDKKPFWEPNTLDKVDQKILNLI